MRKEHSARLVGYSCDVYGCVLSTARASYVIYGDPTSQNKKPFFNLMETCVK